MFATIRPAAHSGVRVRPVPSSRSPPPPLKQAVGRSQADPRAPPSLQAFSTSRIAARDIAKMTLIGRIGANPELRDGKNGQQYLTYKVATTDKGRPPKEGGASSFLLLMSEARRAAARLWTRAGTSPSRPSSSFSSDTSTTRE